ncbi:hypothetical protein JCM8097_009171 [Rhodosporidiobolus ruineniae]
MASINWAMLSPSGQPVPLPREKLLLTTPSVSLSLFPLPSGSGPNAQPLTKDQEYTADKGTLYTTNQRVVFVAPGARSGHGAGGGGASSAPEGSLAAGQASIAPGGLPPSTTDGKKVAKVPLQTLSVPLPKLVDGRYVQPWFTAQYYEAVCLPSSGGGLSEPHLVRFYFKESGGYDFTQTVAEMRDRLEAAGRRGASEVEALPLYTPAPSHPPPSTSSSTLLPSSSLPQAHLPTPSPAALEAAHIARAAEESERVERERVEAEAGEGGGERPPSGVKEGEAPPAYF